MNTPIRDRGTAAIELMLAVGLILIPVAAAAMMLPQWPEAKTVATATANEAATLYADATTAEAGAAAANEAVNAAAENHGLAMRADIPSTWCRGCTIVVTVTVDVPAIEIPFVGSTGTFGYTATASARIADYRSQG